MSQTKARSHVDLLNGSPGKNLLLFALPMILGNLFQQFYNMADSMIVGNFVGEESLAAVGASYCPDQRVYYDRHRWRQPGLP